MKAIIISFLLSIFFIYSLYPMNSAVGIPTNEIEDLNAVSAWAQWLEPDQNQPLTSPPNFETKNPSENVKTEVESSDDSSENKAAKKPSRSQIRYIKLCQICKKNIKGNIKLHNFTHTGEQPYECSVGCGKFTQLCNCKRHIRNNHHPVLHAHVIESFEEDGEIFKRKIEVNYPELKACIYCEKTFYDNYEHKRHQKICMRKQHSQIDK